MTWRRRTRLCHCNWRERRAPAFPDSPNAPEFEWNVVKALANMQDFKAAEEEARGMVKKYPGNDFAADVDRHLLHHPPNPPPNPP